MDIHHSAAMACPACRSALAVSERKGIEIDYCPSCRGVWLDRGELDKIIERSAAELAPPPQAAPPTSQSAWPGERGHHDFRGDRYGHRKRKKSFLEDLFD